MVALYDNDWFIAQVEGEEPDEEVEGFTLLRYMEQKGENQFIHGKVDTLKTNDKDIILRVNPPEPVSNRHYGLCNDDLKKLKAKMVGFIIIISALWFYFKSKKNVFYSHDMKKKRGWLILKIQDLNANISFFL